MVDIANGFRNDIKDIVWMALESFTRTPKYLSAFGNFFNRGLQFPLAPPTFTTLPDNDANIVEDAQTWRVPRVDISESSDSDVTEVNPHWPHRPIKRKKFKKRSRRKEANQIKKIKLIPMVDLVKEQEKMSVKDKPSKEELILMRQVYKEPDIEVIDDNFAEITIDDDDKDEANENMEVTACSIHDTTSEIGKTLMYSPICNIR